jgi:hypothetical protein
MDAEAEARAINAQPWEPPPGMTKVQCIACRYLFAVPVAMAETEPACCPDCAAPPRPPRCVPGKAA